VLFTPFVAILNDDMQEENQPIGAVQPDVTGAQPPTPQPNPEAATFQSIQPIQAPENQATSQPVAPKKEKREGGVFSFIVTLAAAFIIVQVINMFFFQSYKVFGSSMFPTLHDGDRLIISKIGRTSSRITRKEYVPDRGDIIVFVDPQRDDLQLIKRVIGLPGERVVVKSGEITVYNAEHPGGFNPDTSGIYQADLPEQKTGDVDVTVPKSHLFVSGDNREGSNSLDSRNELGTVPDDLVVGTLKVRLFPFNSAKFF
jgi:signal peptidase I